ncbi:hypothetical protein AVEN_84161-1 [Araneus ventricosus]|uniref:Uncharacterized protein n=1 Tax=Araneus ventricosus TaxID=182803 RepID=A0A4Y2TV76_ARAVE|nr:hypothetical protein AVEN_84161-1 [Araneus ventricosus]
MQRAFGSPQGAKEGRADGVSKTSCSDNLVSVPEQTARNTAEFCVARIKRSDHRLRDICFVSSAFPVFWEWNYMQPQLWCSGISASCMKLPQSARWNRYRGGYGIAPPLSA